MHPFLRNVIISVVGLIVAGALSALALSGHDPRVAIVAFLTSGLLATAIGAFLFVQGWIWSARAARQGQSGRAVIIAIGGGLMVVLAAGALAATVILVILFFLG